MQGRRFWRGALYGLAGLLVVVALGLMSLFLWLRQSLPQVSGSYWLPGLKSEVVVSRDVRGVPRIEAGNRLDAARALGFLHGQERRFQMEILRRAGAGELSGIAGAATLQTDKERRLYRPREIARRSLEAMSQADRDLLQAYCDGVNDGFHALAARPFEFPLIGIEPHDWTPGDCMLVGIAMYFDLQGSGLEFDLDQWRALQVMPPDVHAFLTQLGGPWQAPLDGSLISGLPLPPASSWKYLDEPAPAQKKADDQASAADVPALLRAYVLPDSQRAEVGSNGFAIGPSRGGGRAIVANDMHLGLRMPNIWFRAQMEFPGPDGAPLRLIGVTLPGMPLLVTGSNGHVAWAFTNSYMDTADAIELVPVRADSKDYRTPHGVLSTHRIIETIKVKGQPDVEFPIEESEYGPVVATEDGHRFAIDWVGRMGLNLGLDRVAEAKSVQQALDAAEACDLPAQNFTCCDADGHIGWTICGTLPGRDGQAPSQPVPSTLRDRRMPRLAPELYPRVIDPPEGYIATANGRTLSGNMLLRFGQMGYSAVPRQWQIAHRLFSMKDASERDMLGVELDDESFYMAFWRDLLRKRLAGPDAAGLAPLAAVLTTQPLHAERGSVEYRVVEAFHARVLGGLRKRILGPVKARYPDISVSSYRTEQAVRQLIDADADWVAPGGKSMHAYLLDCARDVQEELQAQPGGLAGATWGRFNRLDMHHPVSYGVSFLRPWLDGGDYGLSGDYSVPRVAVSGFGASERMVISPGHEETGIFEMPGGESGHFLSPNYRDGTPAWVNGTPEPLLVGEPRAVLKLEP